MRIQRGLVHSWKRGGAVGLLMLAAAGLGWTQTVVPGVTGPTSAAIEEMPKDADAVMRLAAKLNGLSGEDVQPWHLKASYILRDEKGIAKEHGTLEEYWAGKNKSRTTYTVGKSFESTYMTHEGSFRSGTLTRSTGLDVEAAREFVYPLPPPSFVENEAYEMHDPHAGSSKLECLAQKPVASHAPIEEPLETYCFNSDRPILRMCILFHGKR